TTEIETISAELTVTQVREKYFGLDQKHRDYPAVDKQGRYLGMVTRENLNSWQKNSPDNTIGQCLAIHYRIVAFAKETVHAAATRMAEHRLERIAIVDDDDKLLGILARSDIIS